MIGTGRILPLMSCGVLKVGMVEDDWFAAARERVRGAEHKRIPGELWVMCQLTKEENFCSSVNVGPRLLYSRKVATYHRTWQ